MTKAYAHESVPVGRTPADQARNAALLAGYDYDRYEQALTGFTGQDLQRVGFTGWRPAVRTRVGARGSYKCGLARRSDGALVLAACRDNHEQDPGQRRFLIHVFESRDTGQSWAEIGRTELVGKEPSLTALAGGGLVLTAQGYRPGARAEEQTLAVSDDGGHTWEPIAFDSHDYPRNLIVETDGSLLMVTAERPAYHDEGFGSPHLTLRRSGDGGRTWTASQGRVDWAWPGFGEVASVRLRDGRLLAALRRQPPGTVGEGFEDTVLTESHDDGATWSTPWQLTTTAQVHAYLTELADGRLLCSYSNYHVPFGVSAILSDDGGRTWDRDRTIRLALSNGYYVGWPVTLELSPGDLITAYALTAYRAQPPEQFASEVVRWQLPTDEAGWR